MIYLKTDEEVELMRRSNDLLGRTLAEVAKVIRPGVTTADLDKVAYEFIRDNGGIPSCLGSLPAVLRIDVVSPVYPFLRLPDHLCAERIPRGDVVNKTGYALSNIGGDLFIGHFDIVTRELVVFHLYPVVFH